MHAALVAGTATAAGTATVAGTAATVVGTSATGRSRPRFVPVIGITHLGVRRSKARAVTQGVHCTPSALTAPATCALTLYALSHICYSQDRLISVTTES